MKIELDLSGLKELQKKAANVDDVLKEVGDEGEKIIQAKTPVRTGRLKNSIHYNPSTRSIETDVEYATIAEFGTSTRPGRFFFTSSIIQIIKLMRQKLTRKFQK